MKRGRYWLARIMESPQERSLILFTTLAVVFLLVTLPPYQLLWIYAIPHDSSELRDPSFGELDVFLKVNQVDKNQYTKYLYNCISFSRDLLLDAKTLGIRGYFVIIEAPIYNSNHAIVMFNTTDRGEIYIEPQNDRIMNPNDFTILYKSTI